MKKVLIAFIAVVMIFGMTACGQKEEQEQQASASVSVAADEWAEAKTAEEAAELAGFSEFVIPETIEFNDIEFIGMHYSALDAVAQAVYEAGAMEVYVRKAEGIYGGPITDRDIENEFPKIWSQEVDGITVDCYGLDDSGAIVALWTVDDKTYCVTSQGLGGEEVPMPEPVIEAFVKGVK